MLEDDLPLRDGDERGGFSVHSSELTNRLTEYGFLFDPFHHLEASSDPHLFEYLIDHNLPQSVWQSGDMVLFSPRGGGKTALRMHLTRQLWTRFDDHPFPVHILPRPEDFNDPTPDATYRLLLRGLSKALILAICYRPIRFTGLSDRELDFLVSTIAPHLPRPLTTYLQLVTISEQPKKLAQSLGKVRHVLDRSYIIPLLPDPHTLDNLLRRIRLTDNERARPYGGRPNWQQQLVDLTTLLVDSLGFSELFMLVDGVDAFPADAVPLEQAAAWFAGVMTIARSVHEVRINVKGFIPHLLEPFLWSSLRGSDPQPTVDYLAWTPAGLADLLRARLRVATGGRFDSLDAMGNPGVRNVESEIASVVQPLPREAIFLAGEILYSRLKSPISAPINLLTPQDIHDATQSYRKYDEWMLQK